MENLRVKDIMTRHLVVAKPDDSVVYAANLLTNHNYNGLPVTDNNGRLIGIITEYDLISQGNALHLPTLINVLGNISIYKKDKSLIKDDLKNLLSLKVKDIMNSDPLTVEENAWIQEVSDLFAHHHRVNPIPVVNNSRKLVGIVSRFDLIRLLADERNNHDIDLSEPEVTDRRVDNFVNNFEKKFVLVSRTRVKLWPIILLSFALVGFIIAFATIIQIVTK